MSTRDALRMLRSCPALSLNAVATGTGTPAVHLKLAVKQLKGRGRCDEIASSSTSWGSGYPRKRSMILDTRACPPFAVRRATWDQSGAVRANTPGAAGWSTRSTKKVTAPRVAYAKAAADPATSFGAVQPGCPPAIATRLTTTGDPFTTERLAATTSHPVALAALVTALDNNTRSVAANRSDLPPAPAPDTAAEPLGKRNGTPPATRCR